MATVSSSKASSGRVSGRAGGRANGSKASGGRAKKGHVELCGMETCNEPAMFSGLCRKCYYACAALVKSGKTTWEKLIDKGVVKPKRRNRSQMILAALAKADATGDVGRVGNRSRSKRQRKPAPTRMTSGKDRQPG